MGSQQGGRRSPILDSRQLPIHFPPDDSAVAPSAFSTTHASSVVLSTIHPTGNAVLAEYRAQHGLTGGGGPKDAGLKQPPRKTPNPCGGSPQHKDFIYDQRNTSPNHHAPSRGSHCYRSTSPMLQSK